MKFKSIQMKNYRQYKDAEIILSSPNKKLNLFVIEGLTGAGKTNILNAITWCLFGDEEHLSTKNKGLPIINNITLENMKTNQSETVEIKLTIEYDNARIEVFERNMEVTKNKDRIPQEGKQEFKVYYKDKGDSDWNVSKDPDFRVENFLPRNIQEYFLFDGERLEKYFSRGKGQGIRKEVFEVSQLNIFERVMDHIEKMNNEYQRDLANVNPKADEIKNEWDKKRKEIEQAKKDRDDFESTLKEARDLERQLLEDLKKLPFSAKRIDELKGKKDYLEGKSESLHLDLVRLKKEQLDFLLDYSKIIMGHEYIIKAKDMISQKVERGEIPPEYKKGFIERLLEEGRCICGTEIKTGVVRENIEKMLKTCSELDEISQELIRENVKLELILEKSKQFKSRQQSISKRIFDKEKEKEDNLSQLKEIEEQLFKIDDERVKTLEMRYMAVKTKIENLNQEIGMKKHKIQDLDGVIKGLEKDYYNEVKKIAKHDDIKLKLQFSKECIVASKSVMQQVKEEIRAAIEKKAKEQFLSTIWKTMNYSDVIIDDDYNISVLDQNRMESLGTLSQGESHFLALSFVNALHMVSGFKTPIVIDFPLGRISGEPKLNLAKVLPKFTETKQLILLVTDQEYTPEVRRALKNYVSQEYKIHFVETKKGNKAEVIPYGNGEKII
jgi:DNA sulfur modification protein DndD